MFDIYHVHIQDGDICRRLRDNIQWIAHIHTAGVPGRHEIDETQELNYRFIAQTLLILGMAGTSRMNTRPRPAEIRSRVSAEPWKS